MSVFNTLASALVIQVQAGKLASIGAVTETEVNGISTIIYCGFHGWQTAGRAYEFHNPSAETGRLQLIGYVMEGH